MLQVSGSLGKVMRSQATLSASADLALLSPPAGLPTAQQEGPPYGLTAGSLPPSVVEVQAAGSSGSSRASLLLVSSGRGDVSLVVRPASGDAEPPAAAGAVLSAPAWPLRPLPPLQGVRPVHMAAAFELPQHAAPAAAGGEGSSGDDDISDQQQQAQHSLELCCILWAGRPRSERQPSCCEVFAVRLAATLGSPEPALTVVDVQLLKVRLGGSHAHAACHAAPLHPAALFLAAGIPARITTGTLTHAFGGAWHVPVATAAQAPSVVVFLFCGSSVCSPSSFPVHLPTCARAAPTHSRCPTCPPTGPQLSDLPPHGVLANPATGGVLLALQPSTADAEEEAAAQRAAAPAAAPASAEGGRDADMEEDDVSPRSLAAAVARLAAYTSEEPVGEPVGPGLWRQGLPGTCGKKPGSSVTQKRALRASWHSALRRPRSARLQHQSRGATPPTAALAPPRPPPPTPPHPTPPQARCRTSSMPTCIGRRGPMAWEPWAQSPPARSSPLPWRRARQAQQAHWARQPRRSRDSSPSCAWCTLCPASRTSC